MLRLLPLLALALVSFAPLAAAQGPPPKETPKVEKVTTWVLVAKGPACNAGTHTRLALDAFADQIERRHMSGSRATIVLKPDGKLDEAAIKKALEARKLEFVSLEKVERKRAAATYVLDVPALACAHSAADARKALVAALGKKALAVHADKRTVIELEKDEPLDVAAVKAALDKLKLEYSEPKRDDSQRL